MDLGSESSSTAAVVEEPRRALLPAWVTRRAPRWRRRITRRRVAHVAAWTLVAVSVAAFMTSLAVPGWYALHGQRLLIVTSGSMSPFVEAGDVVVLQSISDPSQLRVGQVATFWPPGGRHMVTHRIVDLQMLPALVPDPQTGEMVPLLGASGEVVERPFIVTKGDANETIDANATPLARVRGVVVDAHAGWGTLLGWAHSAQGRAVMLAPPLILLAALEITDLVLERRRAARRRRVPKPEARFDELLLD